MGRKLSRFFVVLVVVGLATSVAGSGAIAATGRVAKPDGTATLHLASTTQPTQWDPQLGTSDAVAFQFMSPIYDQLLHLNGDLTIGPMLATSFTLSSDRRSITLKLRTDVSFQDGTKFDAAAVVTNFNALKAKNNALFSTIVATITGVTAVDASTVKYDFNSDATNFPLVLASKVGMGGMVSPKALADPKSLTTTPAGSGPYKLVSQTQNQAVYEKVATYWDPKALKRLPQKFDLTYTADDNTRVSGLQSGQYDAVPLLAPLPNIASVADGKKIKVNNSVGSNRLLYVAYNYKNAALANKDVRMALAMATDNNSLAKTICQDTCVASSQPFAKGGFGYNPKVKVIKYDTAAAKTLLGTAGYPTGFSMSMECVNSPLFINMCTAVQASWASIGVKVNVIPVISTLVTVEWRSGKYDSFMLSSQASADGSPIISTYFAPNTPLSGAFQPFGGDTAITDLENKANVLPLGSKARNTAYQDIAAYLGKTPTHTIIAIWPPQYLYKSTMHGIENASWNKLTSTWDVRPLWVASAT